MSDRFQQTVYFVPKGSGSNPYLDMLARSLTKYRVRVARGLRNLDWLSARVAGTTLLHFHWPSVFYKARTREVAEQKIKYWSAYLRTARAKGIPIVWTAHNIYPHDASFIQLEREARHQLIDHANHVIVHCSRAERELRLHFNKPLPPISVMPHPHFCNAYPAAPDRRTARELLHMDKKALIILFFGSLREYKGIHSLIDAMEQLQAPRTELIIAGEPHPAFDSNGLRQRVVHNPCIHFYPRHIGKQMTSLLFGAADIVALPYRNILTSGTLVLAHSMGRAVIAPEIGCIKEMVPEDTGITYDPTRSDGLREAITRIKACDYNAMGHNGRRFALRYGWDRFALDTIEVYHRAREVSCIAQRG